MSINLLNTIAPPLEISPPLEAKISLVEVWPPLSLVLTLLFVFPWGLAKSPLLLSHSNSEQVKESLSPSLELELESPTSIVGVLQLLPAAEKLLDPPGTFLPPGPRLSLPMLTKSRVFTNVEFLVAARVVSAPLKGVVLSIPGVDLAWLLNLDNYRFSIFRIKCVD